ncbi:YqjF family protein [Paenibacillus mesophilus]|uniref:YqjF family protein n=1 Tax=Paenibacillus mesophilus TaxID=2582849 RepID=UPI0013051E51|nr:DUF2071 domain-containing protein [Paenibacillus mesophilus]
MDRTGHRPYPLPSGAWAGFQSWRHLLFLHWPIEGAIIRPHIPAGLELDTYDGQAWITVVPLRIRDARARWLPPVPGFRSVDELNVRTYVQNRYGKKGIFFLKIGASKLWVVAGARTIYKLPYSLAHISMKGEADVFQTDVTWEKNRHARSAPEQFHCRYWPKSDKFQPKTGSLDYWLTERYCLFTKVKGDVKIGEIHHRPWLLQPVDVEVSANTILSDRGISLTGMPAIAAYSRRQDAILWPIRTDSP